MTRHLCLCLATQTTSSRMLAPPQIHKTPGFNPYSVQWSPFYPDQIAIGTAANFGIVGNGRLTVLQPGKGIKDILDYFGSYLIKALKRKLINRAFTLRYPGWYI